MSDAINSEAYRIAWLIRSLSRAMSQRSAGFLEELDTTAADRAVMELIYPDRKLSVPEIALRYRASRQHVQVTVNALVARGRATAVENPVHKRSRLISLTDEGRVLFEAILEREQTVMDTMFRDIPEDERARTRQVLERLFDNLP